MSLHQPSNSSTGLRSLHRKIKARGQQRRGGTVSLQNDPKHVTILQTLGGNAEAAYVAIAGSVLSLLQTFEDYRADLTHQKKRPL